MTKSEEEAECNQSNLQITCISSSLSSLKRRCALSTYSTIVSGNHQSLTISSQPTNAQCNVTGGNETLVHINSWPETIKIKRNGEDILIKCKKNGYVMGHSLIESDLNGWLFGNILFGGIIGLVVDVTTDANHAYDDSANIV